MVDESVCAMVNVASPVVGRSASILISDTQKKGHEAHRRAAAHREKTHLAPLIMGGMGENKEVYSEAGAANPGRTWAICPGGLNDRNPQFMPRVTHRRNLSTISEAIFRTRPRRSCAKIEADVRVSLADLRGYSGRPDAGVSTSSQCGTRHEYALIDPSTE